MLIRFRERVQQKAARRSEAPVLIVALGDSVTQGCMEPDRIDHEAVYHNQLKRSLERRFPLTTFSVINAGVDGDSARNGHSRLERDVIHHQPDLVLVGFGLNDAASAALEGMGAFRQSMEHMVQEIRQKTSADLVLLTPNMMLTRDNDRIPEKFRHLASRMLRTQIDGVVAVYAKEIRALARRHKVPVADVYRVWESLAADGADTTALLSNGLNHPMPKMHALPADLIMGLVEVGEGMRTNEGQEI